MLKLFFLVALFASPALSFSVAEEEAEDGEARLGFITVGTDGSTSLTFNATSIQNAVILGLFILVLGALLLPLFGVFGEEETGYGYGYEQAGGYSSQGYEQPQAGYQGFAKRSVEMMGPVLDALSSAYQKYDEE